MMPSHAWIAAWLAAVAILLVLALRASTSGSRSRPRFVSTALMTDNELEFYERVKRALPGYSVCPQVSLGALLKAKGTDPKQVRADRARFDRKIVDFVVLDAAGKTLTLIELDDRTHNRERDAARDAMTSAAGLKTLRYQSKAKPSPDQIALDVLGVGQ